MSALLSLLAIVAISYVIVRAGAVALTMTGLSPDSAIFQAQSAFMGVGFTTQESESCVGHPVRRRVIRILMLFGYLSLGSGFASILTAFTASNDGSPKPDWGVRALWILGGLLVLFILASIGPVKNGLTRLLEFLLTRLGTVRVRDYEGLLRVDKGFSISIVVVEEWSWMAGRSLGELRLTDEGVIMLNLTRPDGRSLATPVATTLVQNGDKILVYGLEEDLAALSSRRAGAEGDAEREIAIQRYLSRKVAEVSVEADMAEIHKTVAQLDRVAAKPDEKS